MATQPVSITFSIVSHGQGALVRNLLMDFQRQSQTGAEFIVTINQPEDETFLDGIGLENVTVVRNPTAMGFGANHNQAFEKSAGKLFCIVNPDVRLPDDSFLWLKITFDDPRVGSVAPRVVGPDGVTQDNARRFPTLLRLGRRILARSRMPDYSAHDAADVDWTAGMFVMFRSQAFASVNGFDERYFMYLEDADISRRLHERGWKVQYRPSSVVVHDARRASHRSLEHLRWHVRSMLRFLTGI